MSGWQVGDLAVCVDVGVSPEGFDAPYLTLGQVYTVYAVGVDPLGQFGLYLDELDSDGFNGGVLAWRFRKIQPASKKFTEQMRALKPRVEA